MKNKNKAVGSELHELLDRAIAECGHGENVIVRFASLVLGCAPDPAAAYIMLVKSGQRREADAFREQYRTDKEFQAKCRVIDSMDASLWRL
jgi:hypothetical protein